MSFILYERYLAMLRLKFPLSLRPCILLEIGRLVNAESLDIIGYFTLFENQILLSPRLNDI